MKVSRLVTLEKQTATLSGSLLAQNQDEIAKLGKELASGLIEKGASDALKVLEKAPAPVGQAASSASGGLKIGKTGAKVGNALHQIQLNKYASGGLELTGAALDYLSPSTIAKLWTGYDLTVKAAEQRLQSKELSAPIQAKITKVTFEKRKVYS
jgi:hypothetical protein